jgi:hypothetical protein
MKKKNHNDQLGHVHSGPLPDPDPSLTRQRFYARALQHYKLVPFFEYFTREFNKTPALSKYAVHNDDDDGAATGTRSCFLAFGGEQDFEDPHCQCFLIKGTNFKVIHLQGYLLFLPLHVGVFNHH